MRLIDKAKLHTPRKRCERVYTQEELEVFIAIAKEEITLNQASNALNYEHGGSLYTNITKAFIQLYKRGLLEFKPFKKGKTILCKKCKKEMIVFEDEERDLCSTECERQVESDLKKARRIIIMALLKSENFIKKTFNCIEEFNESQQKKKKEKQEKNNEK